MFFEVKNLHFLPASSVRTEVFHSQTFKQTIQNSFLISIFLIISQVSQVKNN